MRIENLLFLLGGSLKSSPAISSITSITTDPSRVKRGSLFIAKEKSTIPQALTNGAYAILYEGWVQISDQEIAWIKVESLEDAIKRLFRFLLIQKGPAIYCLDPLTMDIAKSMLEDPTLLYSSGDMAKDLELLATHEPQTMLFFTESYFQSLQLECTPLSQRPLSIIQPYLFETTFLFEGRYYHRFPLSPLFQKELQTILSLAHERMLSPRLTTPSHFIPLFLGPRYEIVEFGRSERVLVHEPSPALAKRALEFLRTSAPSAQIQALSSQKLEGFEQVSCVEELKKILYNRPFRYALFVGEAYQWERLMQRAYQPTLL